LQAIMSSVAAAGSAAAVDVRSCGMLANTRTSLVCKGLGLVHAIEKLANIRGFMLYFRLERAPFQP
jgi:hypothetical protein